MVVQRKGQIALARPIIADAQWLLPRAPHLPAQGRALPGLRHDLDKLVDLPPLARHGRYQRTAAAHQAQIHQKRPVDAHRIPALPVLGVERPPAIVFCRQGSYMPGTRVHRNVIARCEMASPGRPTQLRERPRALLPVLPAVASAAVSPDAASVCAAGAFLPVHRSPATSASRTASAPRAAGTTATGGCVMSPALPAGTISTSTTISTTNTISAASTTSNPSPLHPEQRRTPLAKAQLGRQRRGFQQCTAHVAQQPRYAHLRLVQRQIVGLVTRVILPAKGQLHAATQPYRPDPHPLQYRPLIDESGWQHHPRRP